MLTSGSGCGRTFDNMIIPPRHISGLVSADQFPAQAAIWKLLGVVAQALTWETVTLRLAWATE